MYIYIVKYSLNISKITGTFFQNQQAHPAHQAKRKDQQILPCSPTVNLKMPIQAVQVLLFLRLWRCSGMCVGKFFCKCLFVNVF